MENEIIRQTYNLLGIFFTHITPKLLTLIENPFWLGYIKHLTNWAILHQITHLLPYDAFTLLLDKQTLCSNKRYGIAVELDLYKMQIIIHFYTQLLALRVIEI